MRLFLGINPSEEIKENINHCLIPLQLSQKGWENPHDYHQTLLFIGEVREEVQKEIERRMETIIYHPFKLKTAGIKFFNRRIMYLSLSPSDDLDNLKRMINEAFPEWSANETKSFLPHLTIKRWQRYEYDYLQKSLIESPVPNLEFEVRGLSLFKSEKNRLNQKYHEIKFVSFKG